MPMDAGKLCNLRVAAFAPTARSAAIDVVVKGLVLSVVTTALLWENRPTMLPSHPLISIFTLNKPVALLASPKLTKF